MPFDGRQHGPANPAIEKLDEVIRLLATPDGWCKGQLTTDDGRHCIVGALHEVHGVALLHDPILAAIRQETGRCYWSVARFNDARSTTHATVCAVLQRTRRALVAGKVTKPSLWRWFSGWLKARVVASAPYWTAAPVGREGDEDARSSRHPCGGRQQSETAVMGLLSWSEPMPFDGTAYQPDDRALEKLDQVIDLLASPEQWCKGHLRTSDGRHCIMGAADAVGAAELLGDPILQAVRQVTGRHYWAVETFNDNRATSHTDVCEVLRCARELIRLGLIARPAPVSWPAAVAGWLGKRVLMPFSGVW